MSVRTLNRRFKAATTNRRPSISKASDSERPRSEDSNLNIAEIADQVGYYGGVGFTELFTKAYGLNPKEYAE